MASDKFGSNPVAPLYNATGRNPRDMDMGNPGKGLGNVGNSGAGGKDFGTPGKQAQAADLGASMFSPINPYNIMMNPGGIGRNRGSASKAKRGGGGDADDADDGRRYDKDGYELDVELSEKLTSAAAPRITIKQNSGFQGDDNSIINSGDINAEEGASVFSASDNGQVGGSQNAKQKFGDGPTPPGKTPRTPEQIQASKDKGQATREKNKAANPTGYGKQNRNRPAKEVSPIARKRSAPAPAPAPARSQPSISVSKTGNNSVNTGPGASDFTPGRK